MPVMTSSEYLTQFRPARINTPSTNCKPSQTVRNKIAPNKVSGEMNFHKIMPETQLMMFSHGFILSSKRLSPKFIEAFINVFVTRSRLMDRYAINEKIAISFGDSGDRMTQNRIVSAMMPIRSFIFIQFLSFSVFLSQNGRIYAYRRLRWLCGLGFGGGWRRCDRSRFFYLYSPKY